jgi:hypothetical protein
MLRISLVLVIALAGCAREEEAHEHQQEEHQHLHEAAYGGTLIELGEHAAQAELVLDKETGTVTVYLWDSCISKPARSRQIALRVEFGEDLSVDLEPVANPLTGETFGDTSKFEAQSDRLKGFESGKGRLGAIEILGTTFEPTPFELK